MAKKTLADAKKGDKVIVKGFTGIKLMVGEISAAGDKTVTVLKKDGNKMVFNRKSGKQTNVEEGKEKYANSVMMDDGSYVQPVRKAKVEDKKAAAKKDDKKASKKAKDEEPEEEEDEEDEEEEEEEEEKTSKSKKADKKTDKKADKKAADKKSSKGKKADDDDEEYEEVED